jgi:hypothetical protein
VHFAASRRLTKSERDNVKDAALSLFRGLAILVSLLLSLAFGDVISELVQIRNTVKREALAIKELDNYLKLYGVEKTSEIRTLLVAYAQSVIDDDWPALANDRLGQRTDKVAQQLTKAALDLAPANPLQEKLYPRIMGELDLMSDYRFMRVENALSGPPFFLHVVLFGFGIQMACFEVYRPQTPINWLILIYSLFIGLILYLILTLSDPFQGIGVEPTAFEILIEKLGSASG